MRFRGSRVPHDKTLSEEMRNFLDILDRRFLNDNFAATAAPGVTDDADAGYSIGTRWIDTAADDAYVCVDNTAGAAVWKKVTP